MSKVKLTGFGDEVSTKLDEQLQFMKMLGISSLEPRGVNGINVSSLNEEQARAARETLDRYGFTVSAIGSPIGKSDIEDSFKKTLETFKHTLDIAFILKAPSIRLFSFYVPADSPDSYESEVIDRLMQLKEAAYGSNIVLLHENESGIYGESPHRCLKIAQKLCDDNFGLIFDPSNFVQRSWNAIDAWNMLKPYVRYIHIKDSIKLSKEDICNKINPHRVAGGGEANIRELISDLKLREYDGYMSIEPHLMGSNFVSGTKAGKWASAALALQRLLDEAGIEWKED